MKQAIEGYHKVHARAEELAKKDCETRGLCIEGFCGLQELDIENGTVYLSYEWQHPYFSDTDIYAESHWLSFTETEFCEKAEQVTKE